MLNPSNVRVEYSRVQSQGSRSSIDCIGKLQGSFRLSPVLSLTRPGNCNLHLQGTDGGLTGDISHIFPVKKLRQTWSLWITSTSRPPPSCCKDSLWLMTVTATRTSLSRSISLYRVIMQSQTNLTLTLTHLTYSLSIMNHIFKSCWETAKASKARPDSIVNISRLSNYWVIIFTIYYF